MARAIATPWRCPPDRVRTSRRTSGTWIRNSASSGDSVPTHLGAGEPVHRPPRVHQLAAEEQVLGDVAVIGEGEILVHGGDAGRLGRRRGREPDLLATQGEVAAIGLDGTTQHLDERRLARPVVADDGGHRAARKLDGDVAHRGDAAVVLPQAVGRKQRGRRGGCRPRSV